MKKKNKKITQEIILIIAMIAVLIPLFLAISLPADKHSFTQTERVEVIEGETFPRDLSYSTSIVTSEWFSKNPGKYIITVDWWNEGKVPGYLTGAVISDNNGTILREMHGGAMYFTTEPLEFDSGIHVVFTFLGSKEAYKEYLSKYNIDEDPDWFDDEFFQEGVYNVTYSIKIREYRPLTTALGVILGVAFGVLLIMFVMVSSRNEEAAVSKYDERQIQMQGKGFKYAFYTLIGYFLTLSLMLWLGVDLHVEASLLMLFGVIVGSIIWATVTILNDAYFRADESKTKYIHFLVLLFAFNAFIGISHLVNKSCIKDDVLTFSGCSNLVCSAGVLYVLILFIIKAVIDRKEGADEES